HLVGCDQEGGDAPQTDVTSGKTIQGPLLHLHDRGDRLGADRARAEDALLAQLDQPAASPAFAVEQRTLAVRAVGGANDDPVAFLEPAAPAEDDQRTGAPVAIRGAADGALGAVRLQVLALAADHPLGFDLVGAGVLLGLPGQPLPLVV